MNKNKKQQSIIVPVLLMTSFVLILMFSGWRLAKSGFDDIVPIENVEIEGIYENLSLDELKLKVVSVLDGSYFTVNLEKIRIALLELPWIEDASIRRQWPSGLHIKVIEKQAVARWGKDALLSSRGVLFYPASVELKHMLPELTGPEGLHEKVWMFLGSLSSDLKIMNLEVQQLVLDERRAWHFTVSNEHQMNPVEVKLGRADTVNRLARFVRVFSSNDLIDLKGIAVIDLRYPNGFAIRVNKKDLNEAASVNASLSGITHTAAELVNEV